MKKFFSVLLACVMCMALAGNVFAATEFVPSISDKGSPDIVEIEDEDGNKHIGVIRDKDGNILDYIDVDCLVVTPVSKAKESDRIPEESREELLKVYEALKDGSMKLPYEKVRDDIDPDKWVIRDLFDASWLCEEHKEMLAKDGTVLELIFDLGVKANTEVIVMVYLNGEWVPMKAVNNGDGTVTVTLEDICPIAFSVMESSYDDPVKTGDDTNIVLWGVLLAASAVGLVAVWALRRKMAER